MLRFASRSVVIRFHLSAVGALSIGVALAAHADAQTIWSGLTYSFTKLDFTDPNVPANQDRITDHVWVTRGLSGGGVYNAAAETGYPILNPLAISPMFTQWASDINNPSAAISAANWAALSFDTWLNAYGGLGSAGRNVVGRNAVLRIFQDDGQNNLEDIYLDIRFTGWSGCCGGGFAYLRAEPPAVGPTGDYNGNGVVDAADYTVWRNTLNQTVAMPGDGADGDESGVIDAGDYDFWKNHFGETVPGVGSGTAGSLGVAASVAPEPAALTLALLGVLVLVWAVIRRAGSRT